MRTNPRRYVVFGFETIPKGMGGVRKETGERSEYDIRGRPVLDIWKYNDGKMWHLKSVLVVGWNHESEFEDGRF